MWQDLENAFNQLNDNDAGWWPFLFMRPAPQRRMGELRVFFLSVLYGLPIALIASIAVKYTGEEPHRHAAFLPAVVVLTFFAIYRLTFAWAWNRRAARVSVLHERRERFRDAFRSQEED